ncbi:isoprenoid synthase domain-containing protein [Aspergillus pseudocaelatus]|uniref:Isoprenoid synthase domain-containing protein n=1 Tax=Aspergillus pseudocaelatus TaxID=1825620 RepID=A0ABQ6WUA1_9EURO|nr:isoprenoid synthase domain-containing protein [Aspergillus pseudocaelatus]
MATVRHPRDDQPNHESPNTDEGQSTASNKARTPGIKYDILAPFKKADAEKICMEPFEYTRSLPGKNTVGKAIESLRPWLNISDHSAAVLTDVMTMLQNSSLMLDDIEDSSQLRRGAPAAHVKFGLSQTINSTTYIIAKVVSDVQTHLRPECAKVLSEELQTLTLGQALDLNWTFHKKCPSVHEYLVMIDHKTGGFFRLMLRIMEIEASTSPNEELRHLITLLGRYYQIRDDYQNLASEEYTVKKGFCDDLSEGKFSFPLIHLLEHSPNSSTVHKMIFDRPPMEEGEMSEQKKSYIIAQMEEIGSLEYTRAVLDGLFDSVWDMVEKVEEAMGANMGFKALCEVLKLRQSGGKVPS